MVTQPRNSFKIILYLLLFGILVPIGMSFGHSDHSYSDIDVFIEEPETHSLSHSSHHEEGEDGLTWMAIAGRFHPLSVHFPIALLLVAALLEGIAWKTGSKTFHELSKINLYIGTLGALLAAPLGWAAAANTNLSSPELLETLDIHRWTGTATAIWGVLCAWIASQSVSKKHLLMYYRAALFIGALLVSIAGHFGGVLVFGADYFKF